MFRPRVIPVLLLHGDHLVKSTRFRNYRYIGDPLNAVRVFNDLKADELVFLDISASKQGRTIAMDMVKGIGEEANMPFSVGGGIRSLTQIRELIGAGAEKVILGSHAVQRPTFIREAAAEFGTSTISVCMDVKPNIFRQQRVWSRNGGKASTYDPLRFALLMEEMGAGEVIVQSIERDGTMKGYDQELVKHISEKISIPVVALGGAGHVKDLEDAFCKSHASGVAAGSLFVYYGPKKGVLINYPEKHEINFDCI